MKNISIHLQIMALKSIAIKTGLAIKEEEVHYLVPFGKFDHKLFL